MAPETWTEADQAQLTSLLAEATEAVRVANLAAGQLLDGSAPDEAARSATSRDAHARGLAAAASLRPLADKALRIKKATNAS